MTASSTSKAVPQRKAVLFCPDCRHESRVGGDWTVREDDDRTVYECPVCDATVTTRPHTRPVLSC